MDIIKISNKLTVYFDDPFWVGVFEHTEAGKLSVSKVTFGAEQTRTQGKKPGTERGRRVKTF